jgi:murein DD-endopeptidase MepM/ murein hydrolase activator NlpD
MRMMYVMAKLSIYTNKRGFILRGLLVILLIHLCPIASASLVQWQGSFVQGGLVLGKVPLGYSVIYGDQKLKISDKGYFLLGFGRDAPETVMLTVVDAQAKQSIEALSLIQRVYSTQRIEGVPQQTVTPSETDLNRIRNDARMVSTARAQITDKLDFLDGFVLPLDGTVTGVYGSQRVYNGVPKRPHYGIDYAAPTGTPVAAPAAGTVVFAHSDLFYSGGTLIIDHGHGLNSTFLHLSEILVEQGQRVERGALVAKVGASGRATGPHLDWRMNWRNERIDPDLVLKTLPANK